MHRKLDEWEWLTRNCAHIAPENLHVFFVEAVGDLQEWAHRYFQLRSDDAAAITALRSRLMCLDAIAKARGMSTLSITEIPSGKLTLVKGELML